MKRREMKALWELRRLLGDTATIQIVWVPTTSGFPWQVFANLDDRRTFLSGANYLLNALELACAHVRRIALVQERP